VKLLLDTHILLWAFGDSPKLGSSTRNVITDPANDVYVSMISLWEIAVKARIGKLEVDLGELMALLGPSGFRLLDLRASHLDQLMELPFFPDHRDPFDRLLIAQARLGPGRIHHCMRAIGAAERALELMCDRADARETFGRKVSQYSNIRDWIAEARIEIEMARLLVLKTAWLMDTVGNQRARVEISGIKFAVPAIALKVIDRAIQVHGGGGVSDDFPLAYMYAQLRTLRLADGPDEVHRLSLARQELRRQRERRGAIRE